MTTPADELRAAADMLRPSSPAVEAHTIWVKIRPDAAAAIAALLDSAAELAAGYPDLARDHNRETCDDYACDLTGRSIALARAINGTEQP